MDSVAASACSTRGGGGGGPRAGARTLAGLVDATGLSRATTHRLAVALDAHGLVRRDDEGRYSLGLRLIGLGHAAAEAVPGWLDARPGAGLAAGRDRRVGPALRARRRRRVCVESLEAPHELRTIVPVGARLPLDAAPPARPAAAGAPPGRPGGVGRERGRAPAGRGLGQRPGRSTPAVGSAPPPAAGGAPLARAGGGGGRPPGGGGNWSFVRASSSRNSTDVGHL